MKVFLLILLAVIATALIYSYKKEPFLNFSNDKQANMPQENNLDGVLDTDNPLSIEALGKMSFPGSELKIEETLESGANYNRYRASYKSEGLTIYGLLTVPVTEKPSSGFPIIIFNHGYIPPKEYQTTERYVAYQDAFARDGYITFKSDYRGHGKSEGDATGGYGSNGYTIDVLNAVSSVKKYPGVNPDKIGLWGHSLGGYLTLRNMVIRKDIKAGVIWSGVVGSYEDLLNNWRRRQPSPQPLPSGARRWRQELVDKYGEPQNNPEFWNSISANSFLKDISGPLQLHHGTADTSVPLLFSQNLENQMKEAGREVELFEYAGNDHNLSHSFSQSIHHSIYFFKKHL